MTRKAKPMAMWDPKPDPTPKQIAERSAEIRAGWTPTQEASRLAISTQGWTAPVYQFHSPRYKGDALTAEVID